MSRTPRAAQRFCPPRLRVLVAALFVVIPFAAACGSSSDGSTTDKGAAEPFKIGAIIDQTGPGAAAYAGTADVLKAYVKYTNDNGGLNGHQLKLIVKDSKSTPAGGLQAANELVREDIIALVQGGSLVAAGFAKPLTQAGIPVICGAPSAGAPWGVEKNFYPCVPSAATSTDLIAQAAIKSGYKSVGVIACVEAPNCGLAAKAMEASGKRVGLQVDTQTTSLSAPSFAAPCLALKDKGSDLVFAVAPPEVTFAIIDGCGQQDFRPAYVGGQLSDKFLDNKNVTGFIGLTESAPYFGDLPALATFREIVEKNAKKAYQEHPDTSATIWATAKLFERAVTVGKLGDGATAKDVVAALDTLDGETLEGLTPPLTFTNGNRAVTCGFVVSIEGGKFADPLGSKPLCPSES